MKRFDSLREWLGFQYAAMLLLALVSIQGCSALGYEGVDTSRKAVLVASSEVRQANQLLQDLIRRNVIPDDKARDALERLRQASDGLRIAQREIENNGDPVTVDDNLARANIAISIALSLLAQFEDTDT